MSARDAAVRAVAEARCIRPEKVGMTGLVVTCDGHTTKHPECALAALATSADVRAGLVAAYDERMPCLVYPEDWQCGDGGNLSTIDHPRHAQCVVAHLLAALGDATDACTHESATGVDQDFGPDKVWACDGCGWRHRTVVADGLARDVDA